MVCILGTSLSAIDAVVALTDSGHKGKIVMASRNGRLPSVRSNITRICKLSKLNREGIKAAIRRSQGYLNLEKITEQLFEEAASAAGTDVDLNLILRTESGPQNYMDLEISDAESQERIWQSILYGLNESIDLIWNHLSEDDKVRFNRELKSQWLSYRVSFPVDNARKIRALLCKDQLTVFGGVEETWFDDATGAFATVIHDKRRNFRATLFSDFLVNATGYATVALKSDSKLLNQLIHTGLARTHPHGGISVDFHTNQVHSFAGQALQGLYAVGSITSGTHFWTSAMNVNSRLALQVVQHILESSASINRSADYVELPRKFG